MAQVIKMPDAVPARSVACIPGAWQTGTGRAGRGLLAIELSRMLDINLALLRGMR
jgi:hypothetical protein